MVDKDEKHLAAVEKVGSDFIPLVGDICSEIIDDHTTPLSGLPRKAARKNLLQQLSVQLWTNNAGPFR